MTGMATIDKPMTQQEYVIAVKEENERHSRQLTELAIKFAVQNNPYKLGDIVVLGDYIGKINSVDYGFRGSLPECWYEVQSLEDETIRRIWQSEIKNTK